MKKIFHLENGLKVNEDDLLLHVQHAVQPSDAHYLTFLRTFDCLVALIKQEPFQDPSSQEAM